MKKILNKMENKELEEKSSPITTTEKKTKPKDPGRIAARKKLAEYNKQDAVGAFTWASLY